MLESPRSRSSFTRRSCRVPFARSTRPLACGLLAQRLSMLSSRSARPNWGETRPALGAIARLDVKDAQPIAVEGHRLPVTLEVAAGGAEVIEGRLGLREAEFHHAAGRVVDVHEQRAARTAVLEPRMLGAVDL